MKSIWPKSPAFTLVAFCYVAISQVFLLSGVHSLTCKTCSGSLNSECYSNSSLSDFDTVCPRITIPVCSRIYTSFNKDPSSNIVSRSCGQRFSDGCVIIQDYLGFKQVRCICSEDLCNEGNEMLNLYHINELCSGSEVILSSKIKLLLLSATTAVIAVVNV
ncbi:hypothetical protein EB796_005797 [Bugula neritina]|uniref:Uncharacterized protein n=1 Tax=Bugula neritina TaxID=10212 RepID=A0A7J7KB74_BUGNE|nr:hypothetical protein EB796_005797 [Bugula neritina]